MQLRILSEATSSDIPTMQSESVFSDSQVTETNENPDPPDFNQVVFIHQFCIHRFVAARIHNQSDAADICQEVWRRAWLKFDTFQGRSSVRTWLFSITRNAIADFYRADHSSLFLNLDLIEVPERLEQSFLVAHNSVRETIEMRERVGHCLGCIIKALSLDQQVALILCNLFDSTDQEACHIMKISLARLKHLLHTARASMDDVSGCACAVSRKTGEGSRCAAYESSSDSWALASFLHKGQRIADSGESAVSFLSHNFFLNLRNTLLKELHAMISFDQRATEEPERFWQSVADTRQQS